MPDACFTITSFLGGEWSDLAQGRVDLPSYRTAMRVCYNSLPLETGAWTRRPGSRLVAHARGGAQARVVPFQFQEAQPYNMEFTDGYIRYSSGASLAMTNDQAAVAAISAANPAVVQTAKAHGWSSGNAVMFNGLGANNPLLHNRQFIITVTDSTHFSIKDALTGSNIDGATLGTFVSGNVTRIMETVSPYTAKAWLTLRSVQAEKVAVLLHADVAPQALSVTADPGALTTATFDIAALQFEDGPYLDPVSYGAQVTPSAVNGNINLTISFAAYDATRAYSKGDFVLSAGANYVSLADQNSGNTPASSPSYWQATTADKAVNDGHGFLGSDVGRQVRLFSEPALWASGTSYVAGNNVKYNDAYYTCLANHTAAATNAPGVSLADWAVNPNGAKWTWGRITALRNLIAGTGGGIAHIGDMSGNAGLAAAFDGNTNKTESGSASANYTATAGSQINTAYVGQNYSVAGAQAIQAATIWPASDVGWVDTAGGTAGDTIQDVTFVLRGSHSLPANSADGTPLATQAAVPYNSTAAVALSSSDTTTAWEYLWVEIQITTHTDATRLDWNAIVTAAQLEFFSSTASGSNGVTMQIVGDALLYTTPITTWRLGLYSGANGWPTCGTYHEGRLWLSGAVPNRIDASVPDSLENGKVNFAPTEPDGTVTPASGISYTFNSPGVNPIFHMTPDHQGIVCGTLEGEWLVQATTINSPLTALNMQAHRVTKIGCANIEPRRTEHTIVLVQKYKRKLVEYFADVFSGKFTAPNLSEKAKHLTVSGIEEIAYQQELAPIMWARCGDGSLIGATYRRDTLMTSQGPTFIGWHAHALGSGRSVESICVGPSDDGTLDTLSMVTNDAATSIRHIEILTKLPDEGTTLQNAWFVDSGIVPAATIDAGQTLQFTGLWPLNGKTVTAWAGGIDLGDYAVTNGSVTVSIGTPAAFTRGFVDGFGGAMPVVIGFSYRSDGQIVRPAIVQEIGARNPEALGAKGRIQFCVALLSNTQGISFGTSFDKLNVANFTTEPDGGNSVAVTTLKSGLHRQQLNDAPSMDGMICWRVTRPYPASLCALTGFTREN